MLKSRVFGRSTCKSVHFRAGQSTPNHMSNRYIIFCICFSKKFVACRKNTIGAFGRKRGASAWGFFQNRKKKRGQTGPYFCPNWRYKSCKIDIFTTQKPSRKSDQPQTSGSVAGNEGRSKRIRIQRKTTKTGKSELRIHAQTASSSSPRQNWYG